MEPHRLQTGWHCIHQATLGLNKGSCCRLPTGYPTQWNPELQVSLWRASWRERSFCDAFPSKLTGTERRWCPVQEVRSSHTNVLYRPECVCVCLFTHLLSGQSHCKTGSWWHLGRQTSQWQNLTLCINVRWWTSSSMNQKNTQISRKQIYAQTSMLTSN